MLLTVELVREAAALLGLSAFAILDTKKAVWGPKWVAGCIKGPGLTAAVFFELGFKPSVEWKEIWGDPAEFGMVALKQMIMHERERLPKGVRTSVKPTLQDKEYFYSGGAHWDGISVGMAGGATKSVINGLSEMMIDMVKMLISIEEESRDKAEKSQA